MTDTLVCSHCAAPAVAVAPGTVPNVACDLFLLTRGEPMRAWCRTCWPALHAPQAQRAGEAAT
jgi:hypothetical protein